jgi:hypothetical protein
MSMFSRMDRLTSRVCDRSFAVSFDFEPGTSTPNGPRKPDPERPMWRGKGILDETPEDAPVRIGRQDSGGNDLRSQPRGVGVELSVDRHRFPKAAQARQGDRLQTDDLRRFEILSVKPDGMARVVFQLVELRGR